MPVNSAKEGQDSYSIAVLPDEGTTDLQCDSQFSFLNLLEDPKPLKNLISLDALLNNQNKVNLEMENADAYSQCIAEDIDIEKGKKDVSKNIDEPVGNLKNEDPLTRTLQRQISIHMGGNLMQLLMNNNLVLPKFNSKDKSVAERVQDTLNNRSRKYKRSASFNSRKVVLLFSVMSSVGTMILIYLTLRLRQFADGSVHA